ncbi:MAG: hypothetical protein CBARDMAM_6799 [uncultured Caballeronia sp.]|nr:MAG: hypothetical protein CBARDMAM_6799 [uncultured Caballeronia sp.]
MTNLEHDTRSTPERASLYPSILRVFELAIDQPLAADEAYRRFRARGGSSGPAAFYRALTALKEAGLLGPIRLTSGSLGYEIENEPTHDRLICTLCGRVQRFDDEVLHQCRKRIAEQYGFDVVGSTHVSM